MTMNLLKIIACHLVGDYVLQSDHLAKEKGRSWYCLFVHCFLYCIPFAVIFGADERLVFIFVVHIAVDALKSRYHKIGLAIDQVCHYIGAILMYL